MIIIFQITNLLIRRQAYGCKSRDYATLVDLFSSDLPFLIHHNYAKQCKSIERYGRSKSIARIP